MSEDFGWSGDEFLIGDCPEDWAMDALDLAGDSHEAEMLAREELALEFADCKGENDYDPDAGDDEGQEWDMAHPSEVEEWADEEKDVDDWLDDSGEEDVDDWLDDSGGW